MRRPSESWRRWRGKYSTTNVVEFISAARFVLDGPDVPKWRRDMARWVDGAQFSPQFKRKQWDGYTYPGTWTRQGKLSLGRGLLESVVRDLSATITVPPPTSPTISPDFTKQDSLRDYQLEALEQIFTKKWGCLALATNAGKGAIIALAAQALSTTGRVLICCDEVSVFQALQEEIERWTSSTSLGSITAGLKVPPHSAIVLAMIPTLYRRTRDPEWIEWMESVQAVFLDEADKSTSASWRAVLRHLPNTHYRIGTSGTFPTDPSPDEMLIRENIGPILIHVKNIELVERGISARPTVEMCPYVHTIELPPKDEWRAMDGPTRRLYVHEQGLILNEDRHRYIASLLEPGKPNAIVVNYLEHGRQLAQVIPDSRFLSGDDPPEVRNTVLDEFKRGGFQNLIVSKILDRGTNDLGHAVGLIFASGSGSDRQTLQRIGRGLRRTDGKKFLFLKDVIDRGHKYFETASVKRVELYNSEGFDARIRTSTDDMIAGIGIRVRTNETHNPRVT